ncbi:MAG: hypothetical protein A2X56_12120 [Nitrospirae bacterium GWC2_57_13]|nr:MAG: hypothetical protein A2X56_12120 [Nitrospirae bacterium GWC2_57_13]
MKIVKTLIILSWLVMIVLLIERTYLSPSAVIALDVITDEGVRAGNEWFGIYQQGRKIGYAHVRMIPEADTYHLFEESQLDILLLGTVQRVKTVINSYTSKNFLLKYFDFTMQSDVTSMTIKGAVVKNRLMLDIMTGGQIHKERVQLTEPPYLSPNIKPAMVLLGLEPGRKYRFSLFNPATMSSADAFVTVEAKEHIKVGDEEQAVYRLRENYQGMEAVSWITETGETIKEESALGYVLLRETETEAKKLDKAGPAIDIIALTMIPSDPIAKSNEVTSLTARLRNVSLAGFELDGGRQTVDNDRVTIRTAGAAGSYGLPYAGKEFTDFLKPNPLIQSDDKRIRSQAGRVIGAEKDAKEAARKLNEWVYTVIRKQPVVSIPSALEVLEQRVGDCNEHTTLYAALARSVGIPTRIAVGIVYMENGFYYHAWPEVWLNEWVAVDPTLNQFPADATHIRFITGSLDRQSEILRLVGKLKVEVLEYKYSAEVGVRSETIPAFGRR